MTDLVPEPPARRSGSQDLSFALAEPHAARRAFERAAPTFGSASFIHDRAREILLERLDMLGVDPRWVVDLGCGTGAGTWELRRRFPGARVLAVDSSRAMCAAALRRCGAAAFCVADARALPLAASSMDLVFANLVLPSSRPDVVFAEVARVLAPAGALVFATFGPETLREVREAWRRADTEIHVHAAFDLHDVGTMLAQAGLIEPVLDIDRLKLRYADTAKLHADLRASGQANVAGGRRRTLTGPRRWRRYVEALESTATGGSIAITCEIILGVAWSAVRRARQDRGASERYVPIAAIKRRPLS